MQFAYFFFTEDVKGKQKFLNEANLSVIGSTVEILENVKLISEGLELKTFLKLFRTRLTKFITGNKDFEAGKTCSTFY